MLVLYMTGKVLPSKNMQAVTFYPSQKKEDDVEMAMDTHLPKIEVEQEKAEMIIHDYAKQFKDVSFTDPSSGKTGFTAMTPDGHFIVNFGFDDVHPSRPGWYYSVTATEDYSHCAHGSGMAKSGQAKHLINKVIAGEIWYAKHEQGVKENEREQLEHEVKEGGVISQHKDADGDYEVLSAG